MSGGQKLPGDEKPPSGEPPPGGEMPAKQEQRCPFTEPMTLREEVREKLIKLYQRHRPEQAKHVDILLNTHQGREAELLSKVEKKFEKAPEPAEKRQCVVDPRQRAPAYAVGDRVMVPIQGAATRGMCMFGKEQDKVVDDGSVWAPGEIVEVADPYMNGGKTAYGRGGKYTVMIDENVEKPWCGKHVHIPDENRGSIRPEVCFIMSGAIGMKGGRRMAQRATVLPPREDPDTYRFSHNARVTCRVDDAGDGSGKVAWVTGIVVKVEGREPGARVECAAAYKVNLDEAERRPGKGMPREWREGLRTSRQVWVSRDEHWLIRPKRQQRPGPIAGLSSTALRIEVRPVYDGRLFTGVWERYDHATGHSQPAPRPADVPDPADLSDEEDDMAWLKDLKGWKGGKGGKFDDGMPPEECGDFKRGMCNRGDSCRYSHGGGDLGGGAGGDDYARFTD